MNKEQAEMAASSHPAAFNSLVSVAAEPENVIQCAGWHPFLTVIRYSAFIRINALKMNNLGAAQSDPKAAAYICCKRTYIEG
ncbi:MAG TPA: hypothetical protein VGU67_09940 [Edaphobacter sp.]|nr:hypothetical protein [Edaphobacter sp.]